MVQQKFSLKFLIAMQAIEHLDPTTPAIQPTLGATQLPPFFPEMKEGLSGPGSRNKMWSSVMTALRDSSAIGGNVWRMVVMMWRGEYR
jgi:hypothetical protein